MNIDELLPFYALDALTEDERTFVEAYLAEHPEMQAELDEMTSGLNELQLSVEPIVPSSDVKAALMQRVSADPRVQKAEPTAEVVADTQPRQSFWQRIGLQSPWPVATALGFAMAVTMLIYAFSLRGDLQTVRRDIDLLQTSVTQLEVDNAELQLNIAQLDAENATLALAVDEAETLQADVAVLEAAIAELEADNETLSTVNDELQRQLEQDQLLLAIYTSPELQAAEIGSLDEASNAGGLLVVDPNSAMGVLNLHGLDQLSAETTYQFWLIGSDGAVSAGIFATDDNGQTRYVFDVASLDQYQAIGVSIEPAGGSEQPTNVVMLGEIDG